MLGRCALAMLVGAAALLAAPVCAPAAVTPEKAAADAYTYGIPLMEFLRQQRNQTSVTVPDVLGDAPLNQLGSARNLQTAAEQVIVQPNNDTLYTLAHLDLGPGPLVLHVPPIPGGRYFSFELVDPYTNVFAYIGTRTTGNAGGNWLISGPSFHGRTPRGMRRIASRYRRVWLIGRTLVEGEADPPAVPAIQDAYRLVPLAGWQQRGVAWRPPRPRRVVSRPRTYAEPGGVGFFDALGTALADNPPPPRDARILRELRSVGVGPGLHPSREHLPPVVLAALRDAADNGYARASALRTQLATQSVLAHSGWFVPPMDIGDYGTDYALRGVVALFGIGANIPAEAMYVVGVTDSSHALLDGAHSYVIHFPPGQLPPGRFFWSLTVYDSHYFLVPNAAGRYSLGDRTPGVQPGADGSLDVYLQSTAPPGHEANWIPTPASGNFEVTLRLYGPLPSALGGTYAYPPIQRTG